MTSRKQILLMPMAGAAVVIVIIFAVSKYDGRGRLARVVDCVQNAGYATAVVHDDGRRSSALVSQDPDVQVLFGGSDAMRQVHEPSDTITVVDRNSTAIAEIKVPQHSAIMLRPYHPLPTQPRLTLNSCVEGG